MPVQSKNSGSRDTKRNWLVRLIVWFCRMVLRFAIAGMALWCGLAIYYLDISDILRVWLLGSFIVVSIVLLLVIRRRPGMLIFFVLFLGILAYWWSIPALNDRPWRPDVSVLSNAEVNGNKVTIHNVRNSDYKTATDFTLHHEDRTYDLDKLRTIDFIMSFWANMPFCHTMVSFGFDDGEYLCFSIETRPEKDETYSPIGGSFKKFELIYIAADERDIIRWRTNFRDEAVYLYRIVTTPEAKRRMFLRYCTRMNELYAQPEWYCTLTRNCTTDIPRRYGDVYSRFPESWKIIINGFVDRFLWEQGSLDQRMPLEELRKVGHINTRAQNAGDDSDFSKQIRKGIPELE